MRGPLQIGLTVLKDGQMQLARQYNHRLANSTANMIFDLITVKLIPGIMPSSLPLPAASIFQESEY